MSNLVQFLNHLTHDDAAKRRFQSSHAAARSLMQSHHLSADEQRVLLGASGELGSDGPTPPGIGHRKRDC